MDTRSTIMAWLAVLGIVACRMPPPQGSDAAGYSIWGYVGHSSMQAAPNEPIRLVDPAREALLAEGRTGIDGGYAFSRLPPGTYRIDVGALRVPVTLGRADLRFDIDLSSASGQMSYAAQPVAQAAPPPPTASGTPPPGGSTPPSGVAAALAGTYWGYAGSTETSLRLCADGSYADSSESSYSGQLREGGAQTGAWGAASQRAGSGRWSARGDASAGVIDVVYASGRQASIEYRAGAEAGCYYFDGRLLCRTGSCP